MRAGNVKLVYKFHRLYETFKVGNTIVIDLARHRKIPDLKFLLLKVLLFY